MKHLKTYKEINEALSKRQKLGILATTAVVGPASMILIGSMGYDVHVTNHNGEKRTANTGEVFTGVLEEIWVKNAHEHIGKAEIIIYVKTNKGEIVESRIICDSGDLETISIYEPKEFTIDGKLYRIGDTVSLKVSPKTYYSHRGELK